MHYSGVRCALIFLEPKILAVADVIEVKNPLFRPYRLALDTVAAPDEIRKSKGMLYDQDVVDACLDLFTKEKFTFVIWGHRFQKF